MGALTASAHQLVEQLREWCRRAEASCIDPLRDFRTSLSVSVDVASMYPIHRRVATAQFAKRSGSVLRRSDEDIDKLQALPRQDVQKDTLPELHLALPFPRMRVYPLKIIDLQARNAAINDLAGIGNRAIDPVVRIVEKPPRSSKNLSLRSAEGARGLAILPTTTKRPVPTTSKAAALTAIPRYSVCLTAIVVPVRIARSQEQYRPSERVCSTLQLIAMIPSFSRAKQSAIDVRQAQREKHGRVMTL